MSEAFSVHEVIQAVPTEEPWRAWCRCRPASGRDVGKGDRLRRAQSGQPGARHHANAEN